MTQLAGRALEDEFNAIAASLDGDAQSIRLADDYLAGTHALYHGGPAPWAFTPKIFSDAQIALLKDAAETMGSIMEKVTERFIIDPDFRKLFALSPDMERLCLIECGYSRHIPLSRVDIFFNEETGDYQFCELNTDGSAGMTNTVEITRAIMRSRSFHEFARRHPSYGVFDVRDECIYALLDTYGEWAQSHPGAGHPTNPSLAVVDYGDSVSADEVDDFIERLSELGVYAHFSDIRDLRIGKVCGQERLIDNHGPITCVWRRVVTSELEQRRSKGADALVDAAQRGLICLVGGFRTWPCATKTVFAVLRDPASHDLFTDEENAFIEAHVPETYVLAEGDDLAAYADKDAWIIKPAGGYNAQGVSCGQELDETAWQDRLAQAARDHDVIQRYAPQYATPVLAGRTPDGQIAPAGSVDANNMEGLYLFNGKFCGVFTRCGTHATIGEDQGRLNMGCIVVHE